MLITSSLLHSDLSGSPGTWNIKLVVWVGCKSPNLAMGKWLESTISIYETQLLELGVPGSSLWSRSCHCWNTSKQSFASCSMHWLDCGRSIAAIRWRFFSSMMWFPLKFEGWSKMKQQLSSTFSWFIWFFSMFWICFNNEIWFAMIEYGKCNSNHDCRD